MMKQSTSFAQGANKLFLTIARLRLLLVMFVALSVSAEVWGADVTINVASETWTNAGTSGTGGTTMVSKSGVTVSSDKGYKDGTTAIREYSGGNITVSSNDNITKIVFTSTANMGSKYGPNCIALKSGSIGTYTTSSNSNLGTWTGTAKSITFSCSAQFRWTKIVVTIADAHTVTWTINPAAGGNLSATSGNTTTVTPDAAYTYDSPAYTVTPAGNANVSQDGDNFTATPSANCTIQINMVAKPKYTVNWYVNGIKEHSQTDIASTPLTKIPNLEDYECGGKVFVGWTTQSSYEHATDSPNDLITNTTGMTIPENGEDYYAVFANVETTHGETTTKWVETDISSIASNDEVVITMSKSETTWALRDDNGTSKAPVAEVVTIENGQVTSTIVENMIWIIEKSNNNLTLYKDNEKSNWLYCTKSNDGVRVGTNTNKIFTVSGNYLKHTETSRYVGVYIITPDWRCYDNTTGNIAGQTLAFYKKTTTSTNTETITNYTTQCSNKPSPSLNPYESSLAFGNVTINTPKQLTFTLSGSALTANAELNLSGPNESMFSVSPKSVSPKEGIVNQTVTVTYTPTAVGEHTATLTISSTGAENKTVDLSGTGTAPAEVVNWMVKGVKHTTEFNGQSTAIYQPTGDELTCGEKKFVGWTATKNYENETVAPNDLFTKTLPNGVTKSTTFYAVYADKHTTTTITYTWDLLMQSTIPKLAAGDQIVISAKDYDYALSTTQNTDTRGAEAVTKDGNSITINNNVQIFTIETGNEESTFALATGNGYLSGTRRKAGNKYYEQLTTATSKASANASWYIDFTEETTPHIYNEVSEKNGKKYEYPNYYVGFNYNYNWWTGEYTYDFKAVRDASTGNDKNPKNISIYRSTKHENTTTVNSGYTTDCGCSAPTNPLAFSNQTITAGKTLTLAPNTGTGNGGTITYTCSDAMHTTIKGDQFSADALGTYEITATQGVNDNKCGAIVDFTVTVECATPSITPTTYKTTTNTPVDLKSVITSTSTMPLTFACTDKNVYISGTNFTFLAAGTYTITATQEAGGIYCDGSQEITITVTDPCAGKTKPSVTVTAITTDKFTLSWSEIIGVSTYRVYNNTTGDSDETSSTSYTFSGLNPSTEYSWTVEAVYSDGCTAATSGTTTTSTPVVEYAVNWNVAGNSYTTGTPTTSVNHGEKVSALPTAPNPADHSCGDKVFVGWSKSQYLDGTRPADLFTTAAGSPAISAAITFYAVFADCVTGGDTPGDDTQGEWTLVTDVNDLQAGDKIIIACYSQQKAASELTSDILSVDADVTFGNNGNTLTPSASTLIFMLGGSTGAWTFANSSGQLLGATAVKKLAWDGGTTTWRISISGNDATLDNTTGTYGDLQYNAVSPRFTTYTSSQTAIQLYKKTSGGETPEPEEYTVTLSVLGNIEGTPTTTGEYTLPSTVLGTCAGKTFVGWTTTENLSSSTEPTSNYWAKGTPVTITEDKIYYAVFATESTAGGEGVYELTTEIESGKDYVIAGYDNNGDWALKNEIISGTRDQIATKQITTIEDNELGWIVSNTPSTDIVWRIDGNATSGYTFYNASSNIYLNMTDENTNADLTLGASSTTKYAIEFLSDKYADATITAKGFTGDYKILSFYATKKLFNVYTRPNTIYIYKKTTTYSDFSTTCDGGPASAPARQVAMKRDAAKAAKKAGMARPITRIAPAALAAQECTSYENYTTNCCANPITDLKYSAGANSITLYWNTAAASATATLYRDEECTSQVTGATQSGITSGTCTFTGLAKTTTYYAKVTTDDGCTAVLEVSTERPHVSVAEWAANQININVNTNEPIKVVLENEVTGGGTSANQATELFFSKYYEATGNVKLVAVYNGTANEIDLTNYKIKYGKTSWAADYISLKDFGATKGKIASGEEIILYSMNWGDSRDVAILDCVIADYPDGTWVEVTTANNTGKGSLSFAGDKSLALFNGNTMIDIIGGGTTSAPNNTGANTKPAWGDAKGWTCDEGLSIDDGTMIGISTNRCLLVRNNTVTSGDNAVNSNITDFATLCTEWKGAHVPDDEVDDGVSESCENFEFVGTFDYSDYYVKYEELGEPQALDTEGRKENGTYLITVPTTTYPKGLHDLACTNMRISIKDAYNNTLVTQDLKVPIIIDQDVQTNNKIYFQYPQRDNADTPPTNLNGKNENILTPEICADCDVVIRDNQKLIHVAEGVSEFNNMMVYPGAKFDNSASQKLFLNTLQMQAKNDEVSYAIINNDGSTIDVGDMVFVKRIDDQHWYQFSLPYDCKVSDIIQQDGQSMGKYWVDWGIKYYNGKRRQAEGTATSAGQVSPYWEKVEETATLKAHQGYIIGLFTTEWNNQMKSVYFTPVTTNPYRESGDDAKTTQVESWYTDNLQTVAPRHRGWNFTGSPYISIFNPQTPPYYGESSVLMSGTFDPANPDAEYTSGDVYLSIPVLPDGLYYNQVVASSTSLMPFRAYFVQTIDPESTDEKHTLTYVKAGRQLPSAPARTAATKQRVLVELNITAPDGQTDNTGVWVDERYTTDYEIAADLTKMYVAGTKPQLYTLAANNEKLAYNALPDDAATNVPIELYAPLAGDYTLTLNNRVSRIAGAESIELLHDGQVVANLLIQDYTIAAPKGTVKGYSLRIHRRANVSTALDNTTGSTITLIANDGYITLLNVPTDATISIYDMVGRLIDSQHANGETVVNMPIVPQGVYNIVVANGNGHTTIKSVIR